MVGKLTVGKFRCSSFRKSALTINHFRRLIRPSSDGLSPIYRTKKSLKMGLWKWGFVYFFSSPFFGAPLLDFFLEKKNHFFVENWGRPKEPRKRSPIFRLKKSKSPNFYSRLISNDGPYKAILEPKKHEKLQKSTLKGSIFGH